MWIQEGWTFIHCLLLCGCDLKVDWNGVVQYLVTAIYFHTIHQHCRILPIYNFKSLVELFSFTILLFFTDSRQKNKKQNKYLPSVFSEPYVTVRKYGFEVKAHTECEASGKCYLAWKSGMSGAWMTECKQWDVAGSFVVNIYFSMGGEENHWLDCLFVVMEYNQSIQVQMSIPFAHCVGPHIEDKLALYIWRHNMFRYLCFAWGIGFLNMMSRSEKAKISHKKARAYQQLKVNRTVTI